MLHYYTRQVTHRQQLTCSPAHLSTNSALCCSLSHLLTCPPTLPLLLTYPPTWSLLFTYSPTLCPCCSLIYQLGPLLLTYLPTRPLLLTYPPTWSLLFTSSPTLTLLLTYPPTWSLLFSSSPTLPLLLTYLLTRPSAAHLSTYIAPAAHLSTTSAL